MRLARTRLVSLIIASNATTRRRRTVRLPSNTLRECGHTGTYVLSGTIAVQGMNADAARVAHEEPKGLRDNDGALR
jgi:hypothetical protein